jgi:hypothetical protein
MVVARIGGLYKGKTNRNDHNEQDETHPAEKVPQS